jgi:hypothetical protein
MFKKINYGIDFDTQNLTNKKTTYKGINQLHSSLTTDNYLTCAIMACSFRNANDDMSEEEIKERIVLQTILRNKGTLNILEENSFIKLKYKQIIYDEHTNDNPTTKFEQSGCD